MRGVREEREEEVEKGAAAFARHILKVDDMNDDSIFRRRHWRRTKRRERPL